MKQAPSGTIITFGAFIMPMTAAVCHFLSAALQVTEGGKAKEIEKIESALKIVS